MSPSAAPGTTVSAFDLAVVGGGLLGMAVAYGLVRAGRRVVVLDGDDLAFRASRGNAGLVWVQGKGSKCPPYALWSLQSADRWPWFARQLQDETGLDLEYRRPGGFQTFTDPGEWEAEEGRLAGLQAVHPALHYEVVDRAGLVQRVPGVATDLAGGLFSRNDGHCNPLALLRALQSAFQGRGGTYHPRREVRAIQAGTGRFRLDTGAGPVEAGQVVLCAGLGNAALAPMVGLRAPVQPRRGQVLVTERLAPFLDFPVDGLRQTGCGSMLLGASSESVGFDDGVTPDILASIAQYAIARFPRLARVQVVRVWGSLRVMTPDGMPVYEASAEAPGAFLVNSHSGVTLAAVHAEVLAPWILGGPPPAILESCRAQRFPV